MRYYEIIFSKIMNDINKVAWKASTQPSLTNTHG